MLAMPALMLMGLVFGWPMLRYSWLSFHADSVITGLVPVPNGGANWMRLMEDQRFWQDVVQTTRFASVSVGVELVLALAIALLLDQWQSQVDQPVDPHRIDQIRSEAGRHGRFLRRHLPQR